MGGTGHRVSVYDGVRDEEEHHATFDSKGNHNNVKEKMEQATTLDLMLRTR